MYNTECTTCGKLFEHRFPQQHVCDTCKNRPCEICGKNFKRVDPYDQKYCSKSCRQIAKKDPIRNAEILARKKATLLEKYGVDNVSKLDFVRQKIKDSKVDPLGYAKQKAEEQELEKANRIPLIRKCILCGKEFQAMGSQSTCEGPHYRKCAICGKEFEIQHASNKTQTCSKECQVLLWRKSQENIKKVCEYCGEEFYTNSKVTKYCDRPHYKKCSICGKDFEINLKSGIPIADLPKTCSKECQQEQRRRTSIEKYGVEYPSQTLDAIKHNRLKAFENQDRVKQINIARYGFPYATQNPDIRKHLSERSSDPSVQSKARATSLERYGVEHAMQNPEIARKHSHSQFEQIACDGTRVDSMWEKEVYDFLVRNDIEFEYNTHSIQYEYNGRSHVTHIDFKIGNLLLEVKGEHLLEGVYDYAPEITPIEIKLDVYKKNHVILITGSNVNNMFGKPNSTTSNGLKYLAKCPEPLIGVDIELFGKPAFPFKADRAPCFYKVSVDGKPSSLEAFYDEKIRWNMILNRIQYSGGFIDANQVLNAMNVTRTCKQPSWFSKTLAKRLINTFCFSDTIVDPFAGWGMRHDASIELKRNYVGSDYNPELVEWHQSHGRNIQLADANQFTYDKKCSVFICPPYSDPETGRCFEDYNFRGFDESAKLRSQCDWLKIVMKNVPNASEYTMVCKIVDDNFEDYIVETLTNKSHFGKNNEYVIVIKSKDRDKVLSL